MNLATAANQDFTTIPDATKAGLTSFFSPIGITLMILGFASGIPLQTMGKVYVGELILIACAPIVAILIFGMTNEYGRMARVLLVALIASWIGYVISDMVRDTATSDYLRGWSKWIAMGASFASLAWIGSKDIRFIASFLIGLSIGGCAAPLISGGFFGGANAVAYWKYHSGIPVCILTLVLASPYRPSVAIFVCALMAGVSMILDTRSIALLCVITAAVTWLASRRVKKRNLLFKPVSFASMFAIGVFMLAVMLVTAIGIQEYGERFGLKKRFQHSNDTRLASATVTWAAIRQSPLLGYGSWPRDAQFAAQRDRLVSKAKGTKTHRMASQDDLIIAHSQILQGWLEGGLLGLSFFVVLGWQLGKQLLWQTLRGPSFGMTAAIVFIQLHCAWHLVFSPFSGAQRVYIPTACVFVCFIAQQMSQLETMRRTVTLAYSRRPLLTT